MTMVGPFAQAYQEHLEWLVFMAMVPGWWQHSRHRARELEADESGLFNGITLDVRRKLAEAGFKPAPEEARNWHLV